MMSGLLDNGRFISDGSCWMLVSSLGSRVHRGNISTSGSESRRIKARCKGGSDPQHSQQNSEEFCVVLCLKLKVEIYLAVRVRWAKQVCVVHPGEIQGCCTVAGAQEPGGVQCYAAPEAPAILQEVHRLNYQLAVLHPGTSPCCRASTPGTGISPPPPLPDHTLQHIMIQES